MFVYGNQNRPTTHTFSKPLQICRKIVLFKKMFRIITFNILMRDDRPVNELLCLLPFCTRVSFVERESLTEIEWDVSKRSLRQTLMGIRARWPSFGEDLGELQQFENKTRRQSFPVRLDLSINDRGKRLWGYVGQVDGGKIMGWNPVGT